MQHPERTTDESTLWEMKESAKRANEIYRVWSMWLTTAFAEGKDPDCSAAFTQGGLLEVSTPVGKAYGVKTFIDMGGETVVRVVFYIAPVAELELRAREVYAVLIQENHEIYNGDESATPWPMKNSAIPWSNSAAQKFFYEIMLALLADGEPE